MQRLPFSEYSGFDAQKSAARASYFIIEPEWKRSAILAPGFCGRADEKQKQILPSGLKNGYGQDDTSVGRLARVWVLGAPGRGPHEAFFASWGGGSSHLGTWDTWDN
jgi:hypothetical protein